MKILLLGKSGQVGWELQRSLLPLGEVKAVDRRDTSFCGDVTRIVDLLNDIRVWRPDVIVNAAAYTAVDRAETDVELAELINAKVPAALAEVAKEIDALLIHYSTDYVFNGEGERAWLETDAAQPLSVYGHTKRDGENAIVASDCRHMIFRTSWVYAARGNNFARTMLRLAQEREELKIVSDQIGAPTGADLIADVTAHAIAQYCRMPQPERLSGIYHVVAAGETSWYDFARHVIDQAKLIRPDLPWRVKRILPIPASAYPVPAKRPLNSRLNCEKFRNTFGISLPHWSLGVNRLLVEIL